MEKCQRCGEVDEDRRTLWMACLYQMQELGLPFKQEILFQADIKDLKKAKEPIELKTKKMKKGIVLQAGTVTCKGELTPQQFHTLTVCKGCRADWLETIRGWFKGTRLANQSCGSGIFVRKNGATVEITQEEWDRDYGSRVPARVVK